VRLALLLIHILAGLALIVEVLLRQPFEIPIKRIALRGFAFVGRAHLEDGFLNRDIAPRFFGVIGKGA
jgi:hypothetical protein